MGLDFTHSEAHWAYSGFNRFRTELAKHEGIDLNAMEGFGLMWRMYGEGEHPALSWDTIDTPLKPLLNHSDCDGELTPEECAQIAPRLREAIDALWPESSSDWPSGHDRVNGLLLAEGLEWCAENDTPMGFC